MLFTAGGPLLIPAGVDQLGVELNGLDETEMFPLESPATHSDGRQEMLLRGAVSMVFFFHAELPAPRGSARSQPPQARHATRAETPICPRTEATRRGRCLSTGPAVLGL